MIPKPFSQHSHLYIESNTMQLLDEIEKAHPHVMELFYQVFDKGMLEDAEGVEVNFKNTVILSKHFKPALLGRMMVIPYYPLNEEELHKIIKLKMQKIVDRFVSTHRAELKYDKSVIDHIAARCNDPDSGARNIDYILNQNLLPLISTEVLHCITQEKPVHSIEIKITQGGEFICTKL